MSEEKNEKEEPPYQQQVMLFGMFWRWLLTVGAIVTGFTAIFGTVISWGIYTTATEAASKRAKDIIDERVALLKEDQARLKEELARHRELTADTQRKLIEQATNAGKYENSASNAAERAKSLLDRVIELEATARVHIDTAARIVTAAKAGTSPEVVSQATEKAISDYVKGNTFTEKVLAEVQRIYDPKIRATDLSNLEFFITKEEFSADINRPAEVRCPNSYTLVTPLCEIVPKTGVGPEVGYVTEMTIQYNGVIQSGHCQGTVTSGANLKVGARALCMRRKV